MLVNMQEGWGGQLVSPARQDVHGSVSSFGSVDALDGVHGARVFL